MPSSSHKEWIAVNDSRALKRFGITASSNQVTRAIEAVSDGIMLNAELRAKNTKTARAHIASIFQYVPSRTGDSYVWKIHSSEINRISDWLEDDKHWVSINNDARLSKLGITSRETVLDFVVASIARRYALPMSIDGTSDNAIKYSLACRGLRQITTEHGNPLWQFHDKKALAEVKQALASYIHERDNPEWINSHNQSGLRQLGFNTTPSALDDVADKHYHSSITKLVSIGKNPADAKKIVSACLRPATTNGAAASWEIRRDYLPRFVEMLQTQLARHETGWFSPTSKQWSAAGLRAAGSTIERAMCKLEEESINQYVQNGKTKEEAASIVHETIVKPAFGKNGKPVMKAKLEYAARLYDIIETMGHREHAIKRANTRLSHGMGI